MSKRQQRLAKVEPSEESKEKAASEITKAVGELEQMEKGSMRKKPAPQEDEDEEDDDGESLSAFGQRQKLKDMEKGVAGRFGTRAGAAPATEDTSADDDDEKDDKKTYDGLTAKLSALESSKKTAGDKDGDGADQKTDVVAKEDVRKSDAADKLAAKAGLASTPSPKADGKEAATASAHGAHDGDAKEGENKTKEPEKEGGSEASSVGTTAEATTKKKEETTKKIADMRATLLSAASQVAAGQGAVVNASLGLKSSSVASSATAAASPEGKKEEKAGESKEKTTDSEEKRKSSDEKKEKSEEKEASATDAQAPAK
jgi:hypothetical protein